MAEDIAKNFEIIVVSLDTLSREKYHQIRGVDKFDKVISGIEELVKYAKKESCITVLNTVICSENLEEIPEVIKYGTNKLGMDKIMVDQATFHDYWNDITRKGSRYRGKEVSSVNRWEQHQKTINEIIDLKEQGYPIMTSKSYLNTLLDRNFDYQCNPHVFVCVDKDGRVALPCFDSQYSTYVDILHERSLKEVWFSKEAEKLREAVKDCKICQMHCIIEPSKVLGNPLRNLPDLVHWANTFYESSKIIKAKRL